MTITRVGSTNAYADGWEQAFGTKKKRTTKKTAATASTAKAKKAGKKKTKKAKR